MSEVEESLRGHGAGFKPKRVGIKFENSPTEFVITEFGPMRLTLEKHGYKTERPRPGETGPGTVISDDLGRAYRWVEKKPRKPRRDRNPIGERPSELARKHGIQLAKKFGIVICIWRPLTRCRSKRFAPKSCDKPCGHLIIVNRGEKLVKCGGCGRRVWVNRRSVLFQHDDLKIVRRIIAGIRGCRGSGWLHVPTRKFMEWEYRAHRQEGYGAREQEDRGPQYRPPSGEPAGGSFGTCVTN